MLATKRREFWKNHGLRFFKLLLIFMIFFSWAFSSTAFGAIFWGFIFATLVTAGGIYLSWEDLLSDEEVLENIFSGRG